MGGRCDTTRQHFLPRLQHRLWCCEEYDPVSLLPIFSRNWRQCTTIRKSESIVVLFGLICILTNDRLVVASLAISLTVKTLVGLSPYKFNAPVRPSH